MIYDSKAMQLGLERERTFASGKEGSFIRMSRWNSFMRGLWPTRKGMKDERKETKNTPFEEIRQKYDSLFSSLA